MGTIIASSASTVRLGAGLATGIAIVYVDNFAFGGEASPIIIVAMLLVVTATAGVLWRRGGWTTAVIAWACVPLAHIVKHVLGLPDTLHPNTYTSIAYLAGFSLVVAMVGLESGVLVRRLAGEAARRDSGPA